MGEKVLDAVKGSGTFLMVGYHKRSDPAVICAKARIDQLKQSGELGNLKYIRIIMPAGDWIAGGFYNLINAKDPQPQLAADPAPSDMDHALYKQYLDFVNYYIHQVNLMRYLLGESYSMRYADPSGVLLVGQSDSGIPCTIEMSPYVTSIDWQESAFVCFAKGWIKVDLPAPMALNRPGRVEVFTDLGKGTTPQTTVPQLPWVHAMKQQAINFLKAIKGEIPPMCTAQEALVDLQTAREYLRLRWGK
jgi:predicted dehydrogenase